MKTVKIWIFIFLSIIVPLSVGNAMQLAFISDNHSCGIYIDKTCSENRSNENGIIPLYKRIDKDTSIYGLFHFKYNSFAADTARKMIEDAIKREKSQGFLVDWKTFLQQEMVNVETALMNKDLSTRQMESETDALVVIINGDTVVQARVGNGRIARFSSEKGSGRARVLDLSRTNKFSTLGGQCAKRSDKKARCTYTAAEMNEFDGDIQYIVMGTKFFWSIEYDDLLNGVFNNRKDMTEAAKFIAHSFDTPDTEMDNGVIVIGMGHPKI